MTDETTKTYVELIFEGLTLELEAEIKRRAPKSSSTPVDGAECALNIHRKQAIEKRLHSSDAGVEALRAIVNKAQNLEIDWEK